MSKENYMCQMRTICVKWDLQRDLHEKIHASIRIGRRSSASVCMCVWERKSVCVCWCVCVCHLCSPSLRWSSWSSTHESTKTNICTKRPAKETEVTVELCPKRKIGLKRTIYNKKRPMCKQKRPKNKQIRPRNKQKRPINKPKRPSNTIQRKRQRLQWSC